MLRRIAVAVLLVAAMFALSGCWGRVFGPTSGTQFLVVKPDVSDRIIFHCTNEHGTGSDRGRCALGVVRALCLEVPLSETNPISQPDCWSITWEDHDPDMEHAIKFVVKPEYDCLAARIDDPAVTWGDWLPLQRGVLGCED
jgi:hypothetical protein